MKRILRFTAELVEELDDGRPINRLEDCGWTIKNKKVINGDT